MSINIINHSVDFYVDKIRKREHFSFTRWGDGEWFCVTGKKGQNCDNHIYFPEMCESLNSALKNDKGYYKSIWNLEHAQIKNILNILLPYIQNNNIKHNWVNAGVWEDMVIKGELDSLIESLENRNFIIVSNNSLKGLNIKYTDFITVPFENCFLEKDRIKSEIIELSDKYEDAVFGFSASMATNVMVDELYDVIGDKSTMIDFGSIWDPFVGVYSRSYHKQYNRTKI